MEIVAEKFYLQRPCRATPLAAGHWFLGNLPDVWHDVLEF
jgi:hypothetical protein